VGLLVRNHERMDWQGGRGLGVEKGGEAEEEAELRVLYLRRADRKNEGLEVLEDKIKNLILRQYRGILER